MQGMNWYCAIILCECGNEWLVVAEQSRVINACGECSRIHDVWTDNFLIEGTLEDAVEYLEAM